MCICPGMRAPSSVPTSPPPTVPVDASTPVPGRSSVVARSWKLMVGEVTFLPSLLLSPLTLLHFFLLTPEFQT